MLAFLGTAAQLHQAISGSEQTLREIHRLLLDTNAMLSYMGELLGDDGRL